MIVIVVVRYHMINALADLAGLADQIAVFYCLVHQLMRPALFGVRLYVASLARVGNVFAVPVLIGFILIVFADLARAPFTVFCRLVVVELIKRLCFATLPAEFHKKPRCWEDWPRRAAPG